MDMSTGAPGTGAWFQTLTALCFVVALIFALSWLLRRVQTLRAGRTGGSMTIHAGLSVGARERVVWIQAGDQHLLLGVAPGRVQTLHVFEHPPTGAVPGAEHGDPQAKDGLAKDGPFARLLGARAGDRDGDHT